MFFVEPDQYFFWNQLIAGKFAPERMKSVELNQIVGGGDESACCVDEAFGLSLSLLQLSRDLFIIPISNVLGVARMTLHQLELGFKCCVTHPEWFEKLLV